MRLSWGCPYSHRVPTACPRHLLCVVGEGARIRIGQPGAWASPRPTVGPSDDPSPGRVHLRRQLRRVRRHRDVFRLVLRVRSAGDRHALVACRSGDLTLAHFGAAFAS